MLVLLAACYLMLLGSLPPKKFDVSGRHYLNILFIGNSYTFFNNMPSIVEDLASYDPSSAFIVNTEMLVESGATLAYFLESQMAKNVLESRKWDYIVFQLQSEWANNSFRTKNTDLALSLWRKKFESKGTRFVFLMTWPRKPVSKWYGQSGFSHFKNYRGMHSAISRLSVNISKKT